MTLSVLSFLTGWDEGCMTMTLGERSKLYVAGHKGYGAGGFPAWKYPPNHSLEQWNILCGVVGLQLHVCGSLVLRPPPFFVLRVTFTIIVQMVGISGSDNGRGKPGGT